MTLVVASQTQSWRMLTAATAAGEGLPLLASVGVSVQPVTDEHLSAQGQGTKVVLRARLNNATGGAITARWQVYCHCPGWGWTQNEAVGTRSFTSAGASGFTSDEVAVEIFGKDRVAVVLLDNGTPSTPLAAGASLDAWGIEG